MIKKKRLTYGQRAHDEVDYSWARGIEIMSITLIKGQKVDVTKTNPRLSTVLVGLGWNANQEMDLDAAIFLLGSNGKVIREEDFVFYGNLSSANGAVKHSGDNIIGGGIRDNEQISVNLNEIPLEIQKIAFTITIYNALVRKHSFDKVEQGYIRIVDEISGIELLRFNIGQFTKENALVVGELYRHNGEWKFNAIGSGFDGGLATLCNYFGVQVEPEATPLATTPNDSIVRGNKDIPTSPPAPPINLSKIVLKKGESIDLKKKGEIGEIVVNLNWNRKAGKGFFVKSESIDLDLGCLFELQDGYKGTVQALGESFGSYQSEPYITLDGDDRTGSVSTGENVRINGNYVSEFKRILVYAFIY
jgi:tellurite resistance protein TerA